MGYWIAYPWLRWLEVIRLNPPPSYLSLPPPSSLRSCLASFSVPGIGHPTSMSLAYDLSFMVAGTNKADLLNYDIPSSYIKQWTSRRRKDPIEIKPRTRFPHGDEWHAGYVEDVFVLGQDGAANEINDYVGKNLSLSLSSEQKIGNAIHTFVVFWKKCLVGPMIWKCWCGIPWQVQRQTLISYYPWTGLNRMIVPAYVSPLWKRTVRLWKGVMSCILNLGHP